jgi:hypothetical protein
MFLGVALQPIAMRCITFWSAVGGTSPLDVERPDFEPTDFPENDLTEALTVEPAHTDERREAANLLLQDRYGWRGYAGAHIPNFDGTNHLPLVATCRGQSIGTLTVSLDGPKGLGCEATFPEEVRALRDSGRRLCEFTRLAIHPEGGSRQAIASLFQVAYLVATKLGEADAVMLEVNPRHVAYYQRIIGATVLAEERFHERAQAPAVLLSIACDDVRERINRGATALPVVSARRSLYTLALSPLEESAILSRIRQLVQTVGVDYPPFRFRMHASRERVVQAAC